MTNEEAIKRLNKIKAIYKGMDNKSDVKALDMAIESLEQESILDKIKDEVEALPKTYPFINHIDTYVKEDDVKKIIGKYKEESEK